MFEPTNSLRALKNLLPSIHQPLPLGPRESQRLLDALTKSFRRQLDREHDGVPDDKDTEVPSSHSITVLQLSYLPEHPSNPPRPGHDGPRRRPTDRHLHSILTNPLFAGPSKASSSSQSPTYRDPLADFDEAVARGVMTPRRATGILLAVRRSIILSGSVTIAEGMKATGASRRVLCWLQSSGMDRDLSWVRHSALVYTLLEFLVAEGLDDVAWHSFTRLAQGEGGGLPVAAEYLRRLVAAKARCEQTLDAGYATIQRAHDILGPPPDDMPQPRSSPLWLAFRMLAWSSTVDAPTWPIPSEAPYDSFLSISKSWSPLPSAMEAHLDLRHPTHPACELAWRRFLKEFAGGRAQDHEKVGGSIASFSKTKFVSTLSMGVDLIHVLSQNGQTERAGQIREMLRGSFEVRKLAPTHFFGITPVPG